MVEQIEELCAKLDPHSFADVRSFENSEIPVIDSGAAKYRIDSRFRASSPIWRGSEARGVKPFAEIARTGSAAPWNRVGADIADSKICCFERG